MKLEMSNFKFSQKEDSTKDFYKQRPINDTSMIEVNKVVLSDKVSCNNGKDCRYIAGYQVDGIVILLFIKTPKNIFSYGELQYEKNSIYALSFVFSEWGSGKGWVLQYKKTWNEAESKLFENWQQNL